MSIILISYWIPWVVHSTELILCVAFVFITIFFQFILEQSISKIPSLFFLYKDMVNRKKNWWLIYWLAYFQQYKAHRQYLFCNIVDFMWYIRILIHSLLCQENCTAQISTWISPTEKYIPVIFPVCYLDFILVKIIWAFLLGMAFFFPLYSFFRFAWNDINAILC